MKLLILPVLLASAMLLNATPAEMSSDNSSAIERISFEGAPPNAFPYSPAISVDLDKTQKLIFLSGQITKDSITGELARRRYSNSH